MASISTPMEHRNTYATTATYRQALQLKLNKALGKNIFFFCEASIGMQDRNKSRYRPNEVRPPNHCAHFVSHVIGYDFSHESPATRTLRRNFRSTGTDRNQTWADSRNTNLNGALIRVDEIYNKCSSKGLWNTRPATLNPCLMFVTRASNMSRGGQIMGSNNYKHIGIFINNRVYHYSNTNAQVVYQTVPQFQTTFSQAYRRRGTTVQFYWGEIALP